MYMLALDLDELDDVFSVSRLLGRRWFQPLRFAEKDHINCDPSLFKHRIIEKAVSLGGEINGSDTKVILLTQVRCFGLYFSPVNFYFLSNDTGVNYMLAEVSNTPWNERHYYLVGHNDNAVNEKTFVVSPFMDLDMSYHWHIEAPGEKAKVRIDNIRDNGERIFTAGLVLNRENLSPKALRKLLLNQPMMTAKIKAAIYWQALKLIVKKVPFVGHVGHKKTIKT